MISSKGLKQAFLLIGGIPLILVLVFIVESGIILPLTFALIAGLLAKVAIKYLNTK